MSTPTTFSQKPFTATFRWLQACTLSGLLLGTSAAQADSHSWNDWQFSGFASFGVGRLNLSDHRYIDYKDGRWGANSDSTLGLQVNKQLTNRWGFAAQAVSNAYAFQEREPYHPELEWMLLSYEVNANTRLRVGRIRNPFYFYSTTQEVGYTYLWARPPTSVYSLFFHPFKHLDGGDITYNSAYNGVNYEYQLFGGHTSGHYEGIEVNVSQALGSRITINWPHTSVYFTAERFKGDATPPDSFKNLSAAFATYADVFSADPNIESAFDDTADAFVSQDQYTNSFSGGLEWNHNDLTLLGEVFLLRGENRNYSNDSDGFYVSSAYRFAKISPYLVYGEYENRFSGDTQRKIEKTEALVPANSVGLLGVEGAAQLDQLRAGTKFALDQYNSKQSSTILGVRYDFHAKADLKVEVEYFQLLHNGGVFYADDPSKTRPKDAYLVSFVIDVVF